MRMYLVRIKCLLRNKDNVFWAFIFPLLLGTFFYLGFGKLSVDESLNTIDVYIASHDKNHQLVTVLEDISYGDGKKLFKVNTSFDLDQLNQSFADKEIDNFIYLQDGLINYKIIENGIEETIIKSVLDKYIQGEALVKKVMETNPENVEKVLSSFLNPKTYLVEATSGTNPNSNKLIIYFYALIAMACTFASYWGIGLVNDIQADASPLATRVNITPTHKLKLILIYTLAAITIHFTGNLGLIAYLKYILGIEFAHNTWLIILTSLIGTISGIALGAFLSTIIKGTFDKKSGIITTISLLLSFLSGLMVVDVKYLVQKNAPILGLINPTNLLTECFYSLYYYNDIGKYFYNLGILALISLILIFSTYLKMRGNKYDSI